MHDWSTTSEPPPRTDAHVVGMCCIHVEDIVAPRTNARMIHVTDGVIQHYRESHTGQFDFSIAEAMIPEVLSDPFRVYQGQKQKTIVFIEGFGEQFPACAGEMHFSHDVA